MAKNGGVIMNRYTTRRQGFTLLEIVIVLVIIAIMAALAIPFFSGVMNLINTARCYLNQRHIRDAILIYYTDRPFVVAADGFGDGEVFIDLTGKVVGDPERDLGDVIDDPEVFDCPSDGSAARGDETPDYLTDGYTVVCLTDNVTGLKSDGTAFIHDYPQDVPWRHNTPAGGSSIVTEPEPQPEPEPTASTEPAEPELPAGLTSLGSTFSEITGSMAALIQKYRDQNGQYPRDWGDYAYTDIGLDPDEWKKPYNGIIYNPAGDRIKVTPADGYVLYVTGLDGKEKTIKSSFNWSLWYSLDDATWYFHKVMDKNEVDISTLRVEEVRKK
jgi:prepilin-type N-terminal cleavage/methylation domain-containing protein